MDSSSTSNGEDARITGLQDDFNTDSSTASKTEIIRSACQSVELGTLVDAAVSHDGLLHDELRKLAWPILLGSDAVIDVASGDWKELAPHKDEEQVALDVHRAFVYYPDDPNAHIETLKRQLLELIVAVLRTYPSLSYFQGFHDIAQVLLLVLGPDQARPALARLSLLRIRDFMLPSLSGAISQLYLLPALLRQADPPLARYLPSNPFWALAATLTLYAHDVQTYAHIARLFDFILAQPAVATLYLYAAVIQDRRDDLLKIDPADEDILHVTLTRLPSHRLDFNELITAAMALLETHPPETLGWPWRNISNSSVLRTATNTQCVREQSLRDGEIWLGYQSREAARQARLQAMYNTSRLLLLRYRRPGIASLSVMVAVWALWYGRPTASDTMLLSLRTGIASLWQSISRK